MDNDLVEQGFRDLAGIATRYKEKFPELFVTPYNQDNYFVSCFKQDFCEIDCVLLIVVPIYGNRTYQG